MWSKMPQFRVACRFQGKQWRNKHYLPYNSANLDWAVVASSATGHYAQKGKHLKKVNIISHNVFVPDQYELHSHIYNVCILSLHRSQPQVKSDRKPPNQDFVDLCSKGPGMQFQRKQMNLTELNSWWTDYFHVKPYEMPSLSKNTTSSPVYQTAHSALPVVYIQNDADLMSYTAHIQASWKLEYFCLIMSYLCKYRWDLHFHCLCETARNAAGNSESNPTSVTRRIYLFHQTSLARLHPTN